MIAHGRTNAENLRGLWQPDEERILREVTDTIARHEGRAPAGWFGAGAYETSHTPDLLKALGYRYVMDWPMDDQPRVDAYPQRVGSCRSRTRSRPMTRRA